MRNLGYTYVYIVMICTMVNNLAYGQLDCSSTPKPANDICQEAIMISGSVNGNTCCAGIENIDLCGSMDNGIWYSFIPAENGSLINITNLSIGGPIGVEFYFGSCSNLSLIDKSDCSGFDSRSFSIPNCYTEVLIHITSFEDGCGEFEIQISNINDCTFAESCDSIVPELHFNPVSDGMQECISSCLQYACDSKCTSNGVWFQLNTDNVATQIQLSIANAGFEPVISFLRGDNCSDTDDIVVCQDLPEGQFLNLDVIPNTTYFIEISYQNGIPGSFDLCISSVNDFIDCSSGALTLSRPMFPMADPNGPYCPGETVLFCYDVEFHVDIPGTGNNCQWLQGIIPVIGGGWDQSINSLSGQEPLNWTWLDEGNVDYNAASSVLSLGNNPDGDLTLEYGAGGIMSGDLLPGGWWYTSPGGTGCSNDGDPDNMYGLETPCGMTTMFTHCFELTVRNIQDINDCSDNFYSDLSISIFNLADGETGCYDDVTCSGDTPVVFKGSIDCKNLLDISADNREICSGDFADIPISITPGYEVPVSIEVIDMGNTTGAKDWIFEKGSGIIPDLIINLGDQPETVIFEASLYNSNSLCQPPLVQFELTVQPELEIDIEKNHIICEGSSQMLTAPAGYDSYNWFDPEGNLVSQTVNLEIDKPGDYHIVVTSGVCQVEEVITVSQISQLPEGLNTYELTVCNEYIGTHPNIIDLTSLQNASVQGIWYDENNVLILDPTMVDFTGVDAGTYIYTFETTNAVSPCTNETYQLTIIVEDCECPSIEVMDLPTLCAQMNTLDLNDFEITTEQGTWSVVDGPDVNSIDLNGDLLSLSESTLAGDYTLSFKLDDISNAPACNDEVMVVLSVIAPPIADIIDQVSACNAPTGDDPDIIDLDDLYISGSNGTWTSNNGLVIDADNNVVFTNVAVGTYNFTYTTNTAVSPCSNVSYNISISVFDCSCPPIQISETGDFCQVDQIFDLTEIILNAGPGTWSLSSVNTLNIPDLVNNIELHFTAITAVGDYTLTYTLDDQNIPSGCDNSASVNFTVIDAPFVVLYTEVDACNGNNGNLEQVFQLNDLIQGGSGGGIWSTNESEITIESDNSVSFLGVPAGFYEIIYTTNHAQFPCLNVSDIVTFTVSDCSCPIIDVQQFPDLCIGSDTFDLTSYLNTNAPGEWYINGIVGTNAIAIIDDNYLRYSEFAEPGEYVLSYELYNLGYDLDCTLEDSVIFNIYENPSTELLPDTILCNMDIGIGPDRIYMNDMILSGSTGEWISMEAGIVIEADSEVVFTGIPEGDYQFLFTTNTANAPCVDQTYEVLVSVMDCSCPELDLSYINPLCTNSSMIYLDDYLLNPSAAPGVWIVTTPSGDDLEMSEIDPASLEAGEYTVTFQWNDATGTCPDSATSGLTVYQQPEVNIVTSDFVVCNEDDGAAPLCIDLSTFVTGSSGEWSQPSGYTGDFSDITNICFESIPGGTVLEFSYASDIAQFPCLDISGITTITVEDCSCPILNIFDPGPICNESDILNLNDLEANGIADGQWSVVDGPQSVTLNNELIEANQLLAGEYILQYTPIDTPEVHCDQFSQITLQVVAPLNAGIGNSIELCESDGQQIDLFSLLNDADTGGQWTEISQGITAGSAFDNKGNVQTDNLESGQYDFEYLHDNDFPCDDQASYVSVIIHGEPIADAGEDREVNCSVDEVTLGGSLTSAGTDYSYSWTSGNGSLISNSTSATIKVNESGEYTLEVVHNPTGCMTSDVVVVSEDTIYPSFEAEVISSPCDLNSLGIISIANATGGDGLYQYSIDNGQNWTNVNSFEGLADGEYTVIMEDGRGCRFELSGLIIQQSSPMGLNAGEDTTVQYGDEYYNLQVSVTADPEDIINVVWQEDGITICEGTPDDCFYIQVDPVEINTYCVTLTDLYGCEVTDCVVLEEELDADVYIPNVFDPNALNNNSRFYIQSGEYVTTVNEMRVYDRWGSLVFEGEPDHAPNLPEYGWDGRINDEKVREGIYMYFIRTTDILGQEKKHSGDVMLIR